MYLRTALTIAAITACLAWVAPGEMLVPSLALMELAFIIGLGGFIEAINRCAHALERRN